ncbi:hypothetical protein [Microvirga sesbaniae]|uniref:hypothetical protein n=1 Tax=Microvirga sesbaniae TaxID=681392 RepID=UPI0021CABD8F|nr:hypothetical protein [Microvirga sp. HBU67692]
MEFLSARFTGSVFAARHWRAGTIVLGMIGWLTGLAPVSSSSLFPFEGTNVAPSASYILTPKPNADYAPEKTGRELTDGIRSFGRFWSNGQSIGWEKRSPVFFRQTYQEETAIKRIEIGTGKNARSMIALPSHALVYIAGDDGRFAFLGDVRGAWQRDSSVADGTTTLSLNFEPVRVRHIKIVLFRDSPFLFLDEVRILSANAGARVDGSMTEDQVTEHAVARRRSEAENRAGQAPLGPNEAQRFAWPLAEAASSTDRAQCSIAQISPWIEGTAHEILAASPAAIGPSFHVKGGWLVAAFRVENRTSANQNVRLDFGNRVGTGNPRSSVVSYVLGLDYQWRADVVQNSDQIVLPPSSFTMLLAEAPIVDTGNVQLVTTIECGPAKAAFDLIGRAIPVEDQARPYGNLWSYLTGPVARTASCWPEFHDDVGVNTAVVNETALNRRVNKNAEALLRTYLRTFSKSRRLLLYMEMTDPSWPQGDDETKLEAELTEWWGWVSRVLREENYKGEIAFYPIDEVRPSQVRRLNMIAGIFRRIAPGIPLYGTIDDASSLETADVDIAQVLDRLVPSLPPDMARRKEIQVYSTKPLGKTLSMSNHYRRLSWLAFSASLHGSGFWSMWDASGTSSPQLGWSDFGGSERDYAAVYGSPAGCIYPSRRLLAWRRGLEDFAIFNACRSRSTEDLRGKVQAFVNKEDREAADYDETLSTVAQSCID